MRNSLALVAAVAGIGSPSVDDRTTLIRGARVFDGSGAPAVVENVLIHGDRIVAVGKKIRAPAGSKVIDARGLTLIPGLHDLHTHMRSPAFDGPDDLPKSYAGYLRHGVTTVNEFSVSGEMIAPIREMTGQSTGAAGTVTAPNLKLAIRFGVPGGHGTEYGWGNFFTLQVQTPRAAHLAMARALAYKPDVIKVFADGWRYGRGSGLDSMNQPTLAAIVRDAHAAHIPVITHTVTLAGAKLAASAGVDALGHGVGDALVDDELIALMKANGTGYVPTLVVYEPQQDRSFTPAEWRELRPPERAQEQERLARPIEPIPELDSKRWTIMRENVRRLKAAGIRIGIGTDAGIGGVYHGSSTIREMRWLTLLGHTPAEALVAATAASAGILRESADHGRIAPGQRADLVLVGGKPDERIDDLYDVRRVFVSGRDVPLKPLRDALDSTAMSPLPLHRMTGPIDTGAGRGGRTDLDTLPVESTDSGVDHSHLDFARPDQGEDKRLFMVAHLGSAPKPYAQLILPLTKGAVQLADARGFAGVAFEARGAGQYRLLFDSYGLDGSANFAAPFAADQSRQEIRIPFSAFRSRDDKAVLDPARLRAVIVRLDGPPDGKAWLELARLRFYRADP
ncbi:amidohydrolase family protein [Sphingomonas alpina]|uniref:Amidohydrolase family protein n=1 Tax=Sphingomonas alpina TaxID=653931 RepID=A0A7H0LLQ8_9SPHN|nr:amidohydrolase family protein [Sphingomonas alpina]QNQ10611.1 amidohydrolase family protein [Sphingomonas alpina]